MGMASVSGMNLGSDPPMSENRQRDSLASVDDPAAQRQQKATRNALVTILESKSLKPEYYRTSPEGC